MLDDSKLQLTIRLSLTVIGVILTLAAAIVFVFLSEEYSKKYLDSLTIFAIGISLCGFFYKITENRSNFKLEQMKNTFSVISEWHSLDMAEAIRISRDLSQKVNKNSEELIKIFTDYPEKKTAVIRILNFLERLAFMIESKVINEDYSKRFFHTIVREYYHSFSKYISDERTKLQDTDIFIAFENLSKRWNSH